MNNYHFAAFACGFIVSLIVYGIEDFINMAPRRRRGRKPCGGGEITRAEWDAMRTPRRGSNPPSPGTKPQPPGGRLIRPDGSTIGYRSINYPDPSADRRPTNPFNGESIPNPPPRKP